MNELESMFFLASISLIYFVLKYVGNLPLVGKITIFVVQILRILVQKSTQKKTLCVISRDFILNFLVKLNGRHTYRIGH